MKAVQNGTNKTKAPGRSLEPERKLQGGAEKEETVMKDHKKVSFTKQIEKEVKVENLKKLLS